MSVKFCLECFRIISHLTPCVIFYVFRKRFDANINNVYDYQKTEIHGVGFWVKEKII